MNAIELFAAGLIVVAIVICVLAVIAAAADAGRIAAQRLEQRAEARATHGGPPPPAVERSRGSHSGAPTRERSARRRG